MKTLSEGVIKLSRLQASAQPASQTSWLSASGDHYSPQAEG